MEDEETLETSALISQLPDAVQHQVHNLLAHGVVPPGVVVGGIFLASNQLLGMEQLTVRPSSDFVHNRWLKVHKNSP